MNGTEIPAPPGVDSGAAGMRAPALGDSTIPAVSRHDRYFRTDHLHADLRGRSVRGGALTFLVQAFRFALRLGSIPVLSRLLPPDAFGVYADVIAVTGFVGMMNFTGLTLATVQRDTINHKQISSLFWVNVVLSIAMTLAVVALAPVLVWYYKDARLFNVTLAMSSCVFLGGVIMQHQALLQRQMRYKAMAVTDVLSLAISLGASVVTAYYGWGYWALVIQQVVLQILLCVLVFAVCPWVPGRPARVPGLKSMLFFGGDLTVVIVLITACRQVDVLAIGRAFGTVIQGFYTRSLALVQLPIMQLVTPLGTVALPMLSMLRNDPARYKSSFVQLQDKVTMATLPPIAFIIATSDWFVRILMGPQWAQTADLFAILGFVGLALPIIQSQQWIFISADRTRSLLWCNVVLLALTIAAVLGGLVWAHGTGAGDGVRCVAICLAVSMVLIQLPVHTLFAHRCTPLKGLDSIRGIVPAVMFCSFILLSVAILRRTVPIQSPIVGLAASAGVSALAAGVLWIVMPAFKGSLLQSLSLVTGTLLKRRAAA